MSNRVHVVESLEMEEGSRKRTKKERVPRLSEEMVIRNVPKRLWDVGREDPRRAIHALKMGVSLTLVSLLYLIEPWYKGIGRNSIWAVVTVVFVLDFSVGATLFKVLNMGLGALIAASLSLVMEFVSHDTGKIFQAIFIATAVLLIGVILTFLRFIPYLKKNHDFGIVIFLLALDMIILPSYRADNVMKIVQNTCLTVGIGCGVCFFMSLFVFPIWSGDDLHKTTISTLLDFAQSIEGCVKEYFEEKDQEDKEKEPSEDRNYEGYKAVVLDSEYTDETLALYARMEPRHMRHCNRSQWQQYVKVGAVLRRFGYTVVSLHGCLQTEIQTPRSVRAIFKDPCIRLAGEVCKVLSELADGIRNRRHSSPDILSDNLHLALQDLNSVIKSQPKLLLGCNLHHHGNDAVSQEQSNFDHENDDVSHHSTSTKHHNDSGSRHSQNNDVSLSSVKTHASALLHNGNGDVSNHNRTEHQNDTGSHDSENDVVSLSSVKYGKLASFLHRESFGKRVSNVNSEISPAAEKVIAVMTSLDFSEALSFAAFASLLVEMAARLENVIAEVEELGRIACFKEHDPTAMTIRCEKPPDIVAGNRMRFDDAAAVD